MKIRMEFNNNEVVAVKSLHLVVTGKELELPVVKTKSDKVGESTITWNGGTLTHESKINPLFIIDLCKIGEATFQLVKPIAEKVLTMMKEFKNKWVEPKREFEDWAQAGYRYIIEYRSGDIVKIHNGNSIYAYAEYAGIPKILRVKDIIADEDITQDVIQHLIMEQ